MIMNIKNRMINLSLFGFSLGLLVGAVIFVFLTDDATYSDRMGLLVQLIGSGLLGMVNMAGTIVYDLEDWGLVKATVVHYVLAAVSFFVASSVLHWFPANILIIVYIPYTIAYFIIWLINYLAWKAEINQMNKDLRTMQSNAREQDLTK